MLHFIVPMKVVKKVLKFKPRFLSYLHTDLCAVSVNAELSVLESYRNRQTQPDVRKVWLAQFQHMAFNT